MFENWWNKKKNPLKALNIGFSYKEVSVLDDVSLNLRKGEILAIIGKSGSGKSTFLKLIAGIISTRYRGDIKIFGMPKFLKKDKIGFVPQYDASIPDLSIEDNIRVLGLNYGVSEKFSLENGKSLMSRLMINEPLNKKPSELSGGQKMRLNIVLSLLHDPEIIILDEPFNGLDYKNRRLVWHFLQSMQKKGKSIVLTSHLLSEIQDYVDRIFILKDRNVFFRGSLEKLKNKLGIHYIFEVRFSRISNEGIKEVKKYCLLKDINILDSYDKYFMFGICNERMRGNLINLFNKLNSVFVEAGFREPNLDEIFMSA
jgi:ABC-2 type transport system ATP-binding protein